MVFSSGISAVNLWRELVQWISNLAVNPNDRRGLDTPVKPTSRGQRSGGDLG
jgi:hypothetical protein